MAAYELSKALGWDLVPPTVMRDGPLGPGSCQLWLEELVEPPVGFVPSRELPGDWLPVAAAQDEEGHPYVLAHADDPRLARLALFDTIANNADRKGGHVLVTPQGGLYGVDHGVCFHTDDKLRTVLWGFGGRRVDPADLAALRKANFGALAPASVQCGARRADNPHRQDGSIAATPRRPPRHPLAPHLAPPRPTRPHRPRRAAPTAAPRRARRSSRFQGIRGYSQS